jgi:hypothetical protein
MNLGPEEYSERLNKAKGAGRPRVNSAGAEPRGK